MKLPPGDAGHRSRRLTLRASGADGAGNPPVRPEQGGGRPGHLTASVALWTDAFGPGSKP